MWKPPGTPSGGALAPSRAEPVIQSRSYVIQCRSYVIQSRSHVILSEAKDRVAVRAYA
jgi:hypothetical protein